jgi:sarcosine oxidase/L-pipecolate oxidase
MDRIETLHTPEDIIRVCRLSGHVGSSTDKDSGSGFGSIGYVNWNSGWADAEGAMRWLYEKVLALNRVNFITATVSRLIINRTTSTVSGVTLSPSSSSTATTTSVKADLTILATGPWTPSLLDLRGIIKATGQVLAYLPISPSEQKNFETTPTLLNLSNGMFLITPSRNLLKIARHGHGYTNPTTIPHPESQNPKDAITISLPLTHLTHACLASSLPQEASHACQTFLSSLHPSLSTPARPFAKTRICWYADTPTGDFLIDYHPRYKGLFVATGGSGHAFKFLPVIGERVVECLLGRTPEDFQGKWKWPDRVPEGRWEGDGSRGGPVGMVLSEELWKSGTGKL